MAKLTDSFSGPGIKRKAPPAISNPPISIQKRLSGSVDAPNGSEQVLDHLVENSVLTDKLMKDLVALIQDGNFPEVACAALKVRLNNYEIWLEVGQKDFINRESSIYSLFYSSVKAADAYCESTAVQSLNSCSKGDWRASADFLAKRFPSRWNLNQKVETMVKDQMQRTLAALKDRMSETSYNELLDCLEVLDIEE